MAPPKDSAQRGPLQVGLASKLLAASVAVFVLFTCALTWRATAQLDADLATAFRSKGEAIALAMAAAAERSAKGDPLILQNSIEANRHQHGVAYIFALDAAGHPYGSTFLGAIPAEIVSKNGLVPGGNIAADTTVAENLDYPGPEHREHAIDVVAPIARATLGAVHVGMDRDLIDDEVQVLQHRMLLSGALVGAGGAAALFVIVVWLVIRPVNELTRVTSEIVRRGDLTQVIRVRSGDEIGALATTFKLMVDRLREIPTGIRASTQLLASSVSNLSDSTTEQSHTVTRQAAALQETQVTAQEIRQTSVLAAQKAEAVLQYAERGEILSRTGEGAVAQSLAALTAIRAQVEEIAQRIGRLGERTVQIGNVTQTVKDLADQTNMLALNAAIEAVRSGEHGKGFAVVAREMRSLADQSIQGTKQVRGLIEDVSAAIREAVAITDKGVQRIDQGLGEVKTSGDTLAELSRIVKDNSAAVRQISAAVGQHNAGISQIFGAVTDQSKMMEDTMTRIKASEESVVILKAASEKLVTIVEQFKV
jgi:methyl-accepting chemotaxis protein